ncbi:MAG: 3-deoxy-8-phosphooctulonate synthase [Gemmatimonadales bacterium]|jgi:2-dehydro-3-deoxyphosphooctonate aldolase (KDO 8-P synthase)|nr:MAG: 3-deoxy-8-phosphooctulonate synthase [Gemmatimonadales bacterium]
MAGPCVLEDHGLHAEVARELVRIRDDLALPIVFKASFDKANRSKLSSPRGPGLHPGLELLQRVKSESGLPVVTDVHEPDQCAPAGEVVDVLQIPAFLCRQTDLLVAAGRTGRSVNIKKGQWMAPEEMAAAVEKVRVAGAAEVAVTERGTFFGYGNLVVDMRSFARIRAATGAPAIFDGTHSVQRPGLAEGSSGGDPEHIPSLVRAAVAAGCDGLFLETHPEPSRAPSDSTNMLPLERLESLLREVLALRQALGAPDEQVQSAGVVEGGSRS